MKDNNKNSILDWEKLRNQPPMVQAISVASLVMLVAMVFTMRQYIVTLPWFTYVALAGHLPLSRNIPLRLQRPVPDRWQVFLRLCGDCVCCAHCHRLCRNRQRARMERPRGRIVLYSLHRRNQTKEPVVPCCNHRRPT